MENALNVGIATKDFFQSAINIDLSLHSLRTHHTDRDHRILEFDPLARRGPRRNSTDREGSMKGWSTALNYRYLPPPTVTF